MNRDEHGLRGRGVYRPAIPFAHSSRITGNSVTIHLISADELQVEE